MEEEKEKVEEVEEGGFYMLCYTREGFFLTTVPNSSRFLVLTVEWPAQQSFFLFFFLPVLLPLNELRQSATTCPGQLRRLKGDLILKWNKGRFPAGLCGLLVETVYKSDTFFFYPTDSDVTQQPSLAKFLGTAVSLRRAAAGWMKRIILTYGSADCLASSCRV